MKSPRQIAWDCLRTWEKTDAFAETIAEKHIRRQRSGPDADLAAEIFFGVLRWRGRLDFIIDRSSFKIRDSGLRWLLETGLYQVLFLDRVPAYAAVDQTVTLAPARFRALTNAFLRSFLREREKWDEALRACRESRPEAWYSHPRWLLNKWSERWGMDRAGRLMEWNNRPADLFIRVNSLKTDASALAEAIRVHRPEPWPDHPLVYQIGSPAGLFGTDAFRKGWFYAQDPSTLRAVEALDVAPGMRVLDACAAPGGKTSYIVQRMENRGEVLAADAEASRLGRLVENLARLDCRCARILPPVEAAAAAPFDRILLDVPCSNSGVIRRRIDVRWRITAREIARLTAVQLELCLRHARLLKPGGILVYSTCSLEPEENEDLVGRFLAGASGLRLEESISLFPPDSGTDGAFVAKLRKTE